MGQLQLILLFLLTATISQGQNDFDLNDIKFNDLEFHSTKDLITESFGIPKKVETDYECGFFTNDQEGGPYYQLIYPDYSYIGSDKEEFFLQKVKFDLEGKIKMKYKDKELSGLTTKEDFIKIIYGDKDWEQLKDQFDINVLIIYSKNGDDGARFTFRDGRLIEFEYWTPC